MSNKRHLILLTIALTVLSSTALAFNDDTIHPSKDDPSLYSSFFFFMEDFASWLDMRAAAAPAETTKLMESAARYLHVEITDLPTVGAICRSAAAALRQINAEAYKYVQSAKSRGDAPDVERVRKFEEQTQTALQSGINNLQQHISPASWKGLYAHINGTHRGSIKQSQPRSLPQPALGR